MTGITDKAHVDKVSKEYEEVRSRSIADLPFTDDCSSIEKPLFCDMSSSIFDNAAFYPHIILS